MASIYRGSGGHGDISNAIISIQYEFDLKTGKFLDLQISEAMRNDQQDANETSDNIYENDFVILNLGYFSTAIFKNKEEAILLLYILKF